MLFFTATVFLSGFVLSHGYQTCYTNENVDELMSNTTCGSGSSSTCHTCIAEHCINSTYFDFYFGQQLYGYACYNDSADHGVLGPRWSNACWRTPSQLGDALLWCACTGDNCNGAPNAYTPPSHGSYPGPGNDTMVTCYKSRPFDDQHPPLSPCTERNHGDCTTCSGRYCVSVIATDLDPDTGADVPIFYLQDCLTVEPHAVAPFEDSCFTTPAWDAHDTDLSSQIGPSFEIQLYKTDEMLMSSKGRHSKGHQERVVYLVLQYHRDRSGRLRHWIVHFLDLDSGFYTAFGFAMI